MPLSLPLTGAFIGTLATLFVGKKWHLGFGILWSVLSLWHGFQHAGKMKMDAKRLLNEEYGDNATQLKNFAAKFNIASFVPGRLRVYHAGLVANDVLARQLEGYVGSFTGVKKATANTITGSLLIEYDPTLLRTKKVLAALEQKIGKMYGKDK